MTVYRGTTPSWKGPQTTGVSAVPEFVPVEVDHPSPDMPRHPTWCRPKDGVPVIAEGCVRWRRKYRDQ